MVRHLFAFFRWGPVSPIFASKRLYIFSHVPGFNNLCAFEHFGSRHSSMSFPSSPFDIHGNRFSVKSARFRTSSCTWEERFFDEWLFTVKTANCEVWGFTLIARTSKHEVLRTSHLFCTKWVVTCDTYRYYLHHHLLMNSESWTSVNLFVFQFPIQFQELEQQWIKCRFRVLEFRLLLETQESSSVSSLLLGTRTRPWFWRPWFMNILI